MEPFIIDYKNSKIGYFKFGKGDRLLIVFPGYGDVAARYPILDASFGKTHRIYVVDLPNHGNTVWHEKDFKIYDFENIVLLILQKEKASRFELMGHSFSGRVVFLLMEKFVDQLDKIYLLAPDGLKNKTLRLAFLFPITIRRHIWKSVKNPKGWLRFTKLLTTLKILPKHSYTFLQYNLTNPQRRDRLFLFWVSMNHFKTNPKKIKQHIQQHQLKTVFILGKFDKVVPPDKAIALASELETATIYLLEKGHDLVKELAFSIPHSNTK